MKTFQDAAGRMWTVAVNVGTIKRVRGLLHEDLLDIEQVLPRLLVDPILLCDVLYCVCKPEADARNVSDEDFAAAMAGDVIAHAKEALVGDLVDFFHEPSQRKTLRLALAKQAQLREKMMAMLTAKIENLDLPAEIAAALSTVGDSSTNWPASSASIPTP